MPKNTLLPNQEIDQLIEDAFGQIKTELAPDYLTKGKLLVHLENLRRQLGAILKTGKKPLIAFNTELESVCKQSKSAIDAGLAVLKSDAEVDPMLASYVQILIEEQHDRIKKIIADNYEFSEAGRNMFKIFPELHKSWELIEHRISMLYIIFILPFLDKEKLLRPLVDSLISREPRNIGIRDLNHLKESLLIFDKFMVLVNGEIRVIKEANEPLCFEQLKIIILKSCDLFNTRMRPPNVAAGRFFNRWLAGFRLMVEALSEVDFFSSKLASRFELDADELCPGFVVKDRYLLERLDLGSYFANSKAAGVPNDDSQVEPANAPNNVLQNADAVLNSRISEILAWAETIPVSQKKSYARHEIQALCQILAQAGSFRKEEVLYALRKLEYFRKIISVSEDGKTMRFLEEEQDIGIYASIFSEIEGSEKSKNLDHLRRIMVDLQKKIVDLEKNILTNQVWIDQNEAKAFQILERYSILETDLKNLNAEILSLSDQLRQLLAERDFTKMAQVNAQIHDNRQKKDLAQEEFDRIEINGLHAKVKERKSVQLKLNLELHVLRARKRSLERDLFQLVASF